MILPVTLVTAGAAALVNVWLAMRVGSVRTQEKILMGDGGNPRLIARMRAHANFAEFAPFVLILLGLIELAQGTSIILWAVGAIFIVGRILHGLGMDGLARGRFIGTVITLLTLLGLGLYAAAIPFLAEGRVAPIDTIEALPRGG